MVWAKVMVVRVGNVQLSTQQDEAFQFVQGEKRPNRAFLYERLNGQWCHLRTWGLKAQGHIWEEIEIIRSALAIFRE